MALRSESSHQYSRQKRIFFMRLEHGLALWSAFESIFWFGLFCIALKLGSIFATTSDLMDFMDETESNWYFRKIFGEIDYVDQQIRSEWKKCFSVLKNSNIFVFPVRYLLIHYVLVQVFAIYSVVNLFLLVAIFKVRQKFSQKIE